MRKGLLYSALMMAFIVCGLTSKAQTTLALGDIAFTGYNADAPTDEFSFVILRTGGIAAGTVIKFTSRGWADAPSGTCGTNSWGATVEEEVTWTAAVAIPYGRQIRITGLTAAYAYGAPGTVTGTALNLSSVGDQVFAYQGTQTGVHTMIAGIHMNEEIGVTDATNWDNTTAPTGTQSSRPDCLTNGTYSLFFSPEVDNARVRPSVVLTGNPATDRSRINNAANWETDDANPFTLPGALSGLPVDFSWVKAVERSGRISVEWGIATEEEMKDYTIEKSDDGRLYADVGVIPATGNKTYTWSDLQPANGNNFYRIRATEINGTVKYSTVAIVNLSKTGKGIGVYPNRITNSQFSLKMTNLPAGNYKLNMVNTVGQIIWSRNLTHTGGSATQTITLPGSIQKGVYRVSMSAGGENAVTTIIVE